MPTMEELEKYFKSIKIPQTVRFDRGTTWHDIPQHVGQYIALIKEKGLGPYTTQPSFDRLVMLKTYLEQQQLTAN